MDEAEHNNRDVGRILKDTFNSPSEPSPQGGDHPGFVRTSRLAVVACMLAVVSLLLLPGLIPISRRTTPHIVREAYQLTTLTTALSAAALGIVSLVRIGLHRGRLTGRGFAWIGAMAPAVQWLFFFILVLPAMPRSIAFRITCGTNLSGIGKAMVIYSNDYEDQLPRAGGPTSQWTGRVVDWKAPNRHGAYGLSSNGAGGRVSVSASLYLLVKYAEVTPKSFLCGATDRKKQEEGLTEFRLGMYRVQDQRAELINFWDFGPNPPKHCSYAYHMVYGSTPLTVSSPAGFALAADRNPWMDSPSVKARDFSAFQPDIPPFNGASAQGKAGNTFRHSGEGQNVVFLDTHADFEKRPFCGLDDDNIYTVSANPANGDPVGTPPKIGAQPANQRDSVLVNDPVLPTR